MDLGIDISIVKKREKDNGQQDTQCCCSVGTSASCTERANNKQLIIYNQYLQ
jgi:hypothetical protein